MRRVITSVAVIATFLAMSSCSDSGSDADRPAQSASDAASPATGTAEARQLLTTAMNKLATTPAHITATQTMGSEYLMVDATIDQAAHKSVVKVTGSQIVETITIGPDIYLKRPGAVKPWVHAQTAKLRADSSLQAFTKPGELLGLFGVFYGATSARETATGKVRGTADLRQAAQNAPSGGLRDHLTSMAAFAGEQATSVSYYASLDDSGRFVAVTYDVKGARYTLSVEVKIDGYGKVVTVDRPAPAQVEEANAELYAAL